jgi:hypothetical protein
LENLILKQSSFAADVVFKKKALLKDKSVKYKTKFAALSPPMVKAAR